MPGFDNNVLFAGNVDFRGVDPITPQVTTDGQLLIGSTATPNIRVAQLAHADGSITVTNGAGTIDLSGTQATTTQKGSVTLATSAETIAGTNSTNPVVPTGLKAKLGSQQINAMPYGQGDSSAISWTNQLTNGQIVIGSTLGSPQAASLTSPGATIVYTPGSNKIDSDIANATTAQIGGSALATNLEVQQGTVSTKTLVPSSFSNYMGDLDFTGFVSWSGAGAYFDDTTLGTFQLLRGGTGYIQGKLVTWAAQNITGMTAGNTYYIYIDSTGTIGKSTSRTDQLFLDNIVLFECLRDSTPVTNNQVTVKENHPYNYPATVSNYEHDNIGTLIENFANGANITLNGTQAIQINGADVLSDHGLETTIPDSGGVGVTWIKMYTDAAGKWARQNATTTFTGFYNNAGTPTALSANRFAVYTLYVSKDTITSVTPTYFAVLNTSQHLTKGQASTEIANGTTAKASNELAQLELCQLGYIIYGQAAAAIVQVIISKSTLRQTLSTAGSNAASLINTNTANFNGWLSAANTNVQSALDTLDDVLKGGTANQVVVSTGAGAMPTYSTATYPTTTGAGEMLFSNSQNTVISGNSLTGGFTFTSSTASVERSVTITNTDNTNPTSAATLKLITGGANAGDPKTQYSTTTTTWCCGIDNNATVPSADPFVISQGTTLGTNNVMSVATTGEVTFPLQSAFSAYLAATVLNKTGAGTTYQLGTDALTEIFDRNSDFVTSGTFTAPITGLYALAASMNDAGNNANVYAHIVRIVTSNRTYSAASRIPPGTGFDGSASCCYICDMDAGDTAVVNVIVYGSTGGDTTDIYGDASFATGFQGYLLG